MFLVKQAEWNILPLAQANNNRQSYQAQALQKETNHINRKFIKKWPKFLISN
jgi:hypothetical protein